MSGRLEIKSIRRQSRSDNCLACQENFIFTGELLLVGQVGPEVAQLRLHFAHSVKRCHVLDVEALHILLFRDNRGEVE